MGIRITIKRFFFFFLNNINKLVIIIIHESIMNQLLINKNIYVS